MLTLPDKSLIEYTKPATVHEKPKEMKRKEMKRKLET